MHEDRIYGLLALVRERATPLTVDYTESAASLFTALSLDYESIVHAAPEKVPL